MTVFELIKGQMGLVMYMVNEFVTAGVSLNRINKFLQTSEMIDEFTDGFRRSLTPQGLLEAQQDGLVRIKDATFSWGSARGSATPSFSIHIPDITFVKGKINLITGPTGSGKSSLLKVGSSHVSKLTSSPSLASCTIVAAPSPSSISHERGVSRMPLRKAGSCPKH